MIYFDTENRTIIYESYPVAVQMIPLDNFHIQVFFDDGYFRSITAYPFTSSEIFSLFPYGRSRNCLRNFTGYHGTERYFTHNNRKKDITATIKITPKKGWKLTKIEVQNMYDGTKRVKNNSKITLSIKGTGTGVYAYFKNTKTGVVQVLNLGYGSGDFPSRNYYD